MGQKTTATGWRKARLQHAILKSDSRACTELP